MTVDLKNVKVCSQSSFARINETSDDTLTFVEAIVVVSTYRSGTEWRRSWSDGWCEQGGQTGTVAHNKMTTVILGQSYVNSGYTINITGIGDYSNTAGSNPTITARANGSFSITNGNVLPQVFMWETKGYIR